MTPQVCTRSASMISIDSGQVDEIEALSHLANHVTSNPSLIYQAMSQQLSNKDTPLCNDEKKNGNRYPYNIATAFFAKKILSKISGELSVQIDPRTSHSFKESLASTLNLLENLENVGANKDRILLKVASTEVGFKLIRHLQRQGIRCNATCVMSLCQAERAVDSGASMIACYVARVKDWYDRKGIVLPYHPGIVLTDQIFSYLTKLSSSTRLMAASFRTTDEILLINPQIIITVSPTLLKKGLKGSTLSINTSYHFDERLIDTMYKANLKESLQKFSKDADLIESVFLQNRS